MEAIKFNARVGDAELCIHGFPVGQYLAVTKVRKARWECYHRPSKNLCFTGTFCTRESAVTFCEQFEELISSLGINMALLSPEYPFTKQQQRRISRFFWRYQNGK